MHKFARSSLSVCLAAAALCSGCRFAQPSNTKLAPVRGTVTLNGAPLPRAIVKFESIDNRPSSDTTKADGTYELAYDHRQKGAWIGSHIVRISKHFNPVTEEPRKPLPDRYDSQSELIVRVKSGENVFDFHLTDDEAEPSATPEQSSGESAPGEAADPATPAN